MKPLDPRLLRYARRSAAYIAVLAALGAVTAGLVIVQAQLLATAIAAAFTGGATLGSLRAVLIGLAAVAAARAATSWASEAAAHKAGTAATSELRGRLLARALRLGPAWLGGQRTAELAELATKGIDDLDGYFTSYLPKLILAVAVPLAVLARITAADPVSGLTVAVTLPLVPVFGALIGLATRRHAQQRWQALGTLAHHFLDVVTGLPTLRVFGRARAQRASIEKVTGDYRRATMATLRLAFLSSFALELIATMSVALVAVGIGLRLVSGHLDLRTGLLALILAPEAYLPLRNAGAQFHATADGLAAAGKVFAVLETPGPPLAAARQANRAAGPRPGTPDGSGKLITARSGRRPADAGDGGGRPTRPAAVESITVDDLGVRHEGRPAPAPDGLSLTVRAGRVTALAGPSGCGKSTLLSVLLGFTSPSSGRVTVRGSLPGPRPGDGGGYPAGGREPGLPDPGPGGARPAALVRDGLGAADIAESDLGDLDPDGWRALAGWVPQDPVLFPGTVADNIRLGWPDAPDHAVAAAAGAAALDDVPLDRVLGDRGTGLSAGQRRRVALARALLPRGGGTGPLVLLLDEPTAGLDARTEARVVGTLRAQARAGRAVLAVSHHPAILEAADEVVRIAPPAGPGEQSAGAPPALEEVPA